MHKEPDVRVDAAAVLAGGDETLPPPRGGSPRLEAELMDALSADVLQALEAIGFPAFVVDLDRRVRWQNAAGIRTFGDMRGRLDASIIAPEDVPRAREAFARKQMGAAHTELELTVVRADSTRVRVAVSSVPLRGADNAMIGSFGLVKVLAEAGPAAASAPKLTPRQCQTLTLLAAGYSTSQMAEVMGISNETVRNHVKRLLRRLEARSRIEAVAKGRRASLI
jgi:DNA-binding CsgD family transcriptional regulator